STSYGSVITRPSTLSVVSVVVVAGHALEHLGQRPERAADAPAGQAGFFFAPADFLLHRRALSLGQFLRQLAGFVEQLLHFVHICALYRGRQVGVRLIQQEMRRRLEALLGQHGIAADLLELSEGPESRACLTELALAKFCRRNLAEIIGQQILVALLRGVP